MAATLFIAGFALSATAVAEPNADKPEPSGLRQGLELARPFCPYTAKLTGTLGDKKTNQAIDLSAADAMVWVTHKVDVDAIEDQCISEVEITSKVMERGCEFSLLFQADGQRPGLHLTHAFLEADSFCPGWRDEQEGRYVWKPGWDSPTLTLSQPKVDDRTADRSCVDLQMDVQGQLTLQTGVRKTQFSLDDMSIRGKFDSVGDTGAICPAKRVQRVERVEPAIAPPTVRPNRFAADLTGQVGFELQLQHHRQTSLADNVVEFEWGGSVSNPTRTPGYNLTARYLPGWVGAEWRYSNATAHPYLSSLGGSVDVDSADMPIMALVRWDRPNFRPALRLGGALNKSTYFYRRTTDSVVVASDTDADADAAKTGPDTARSVVNTWGSIDSDALVTKLPVVGAEVDAHLDGLYARAWLDTGFIASEYARISGGVEASASLTNSLFVNGLLEIQESSIKLYGADTDVQVGNVNTRVFHLVFQAGYMY